jgi:hypothetical protein
MNLPTSNFVYSATIKNEQDISFDGLELFPNLNEISFQSRVFQSYGECVRSCKGLLEDITKDINGSTNKFKVGAEVNPIHSGTPSLSKDWMDGEVSRFWIYQSSMEGSGGILAIGRGSIVAVERESSQLS